LILWPDGRQEFLSTDRLVERELDLVRSAYRRNILWTVAPDGGVWYIDGSKDELHRRDDAGLTVYPLPSSSDPGRNLEVDSNNHIWSVCFSGLLRMSPVPDFALDIRPDVWLLTPGGKRHGQVEVNSQEGYAGSVWLEFVDLPTGVTTKLATNPVPAGQTAGLGLVALDLEAAPETALGTYHITLSGTDHALTHTIPFTVSIVTTVFEHFLPLVLR
jgi:hypothetical protein